MVWVSYKPSKQSHLFYVLVCLLLMVDPYQYCSKLGVIIYYNILLQHHIVFNVSLLACNITNTPTAVSLLLSGRLLVTKNQLKCAGIRGK